MGLKDTLKSVIGLDNEDEEITEEEVEEMKEKVASEAPKKEEFRPFFGSDNKMNQSAHGVKVTTASGMKFVIIEPKSFDECPKLVDSIKGRRPVIINLEKVETETAKKIFDFLSGAIYALNGSVRKVANNIFIFAPESVDIIAGQDGNMDFGSSLWK